MSASFGQWPASEGGGGAAALTPIAVVQLQLGTGTEGITSQVGDLVTGVTVNDVGDYELSLDPAAGVSDPDSLYIIATPGDFTAKIVVVFPTMPTIALNVFDAAGVHQPISRVWLAVYYRSV